MQRTLCASFVSPQDSMSSFNASLQQVHDVMQLTSALPARRLHMPPRCMTQHRHKHKSCSIFKVLACCTAATPASTAAVFAAMHHATHAALAASQLGKAGSGHEQMPSVGFQVPPLGQPVHTPEASHVRMPAGPGHVHFFATSFHDTFTPQSQTEPCREAPSAHVHEYTSPAFAPGV